MIARLNQAIAAACAATLAACGTVEHNDHFPLNASAVTVAKSSELTKRLLSNSTRLSFHSIYHGTQYEYHAANGQTFLWYPGNPSTVHGEWKVDAQGRGGQTRICYRYGRFSYNPVTKQRGGEWECRPFTRVDVAGGGTIKGDPFNLKSGRIPFVMQGKSFYSPQAVMTSLGKDPTMIDYITNISEID